MSREGDRRTDRQTGGWTCSMILTSGDCVFPSCVKDVHYITSPRSLFVFACAFASTLSARSTSG